VHTVKAYDKVESYLHWYLILALGGSQCLASCLQQFYAGEKSSGYPWNGRMDGPDDLLHDPYGRFGVGNTVDKFLAENQA
jgi:hypothetical protein